MAKRRSAPATKVTDCATAMAMDPAGNVLVTGYSWASSNGYSWYDFATIKYSSSVQAYLGVQHTGAQPVLSWTNTGFNLQSGPGIQGPFLNIPGATSPYSISTTGSQQYFRLQAN